RKGVLPTVDPSGEVRILRSLADAHCAGANVAWSRYYPERGRVVALPTYPWQRVHVEMAGANPGRPDGPLAQLLVLSERNDAALRAKAREYLPHVSKASEEEVVDLCYSAATSAVHFECRAAVVAKGRDELCTALETLAKGAVPSGAVRDDIQ